MSDDVFAASRLTIARQRRGLTKKALAEEIDVSAAALTEFENGSRSPAATTISRLATALELPTEFFYGEAISDFNHPGFAAFRALRSMSARIRNRVFATGQIACAVISPYLLDKFTLPEPQIPDLAIDATNPSMAAEALRNEWKLGQAPIPNVIHLLELKGVQVYWINEQSPTLDAFSFWSDGRPYIIVNANRDGERQRLSIAHEAGHLAFRHDIAANDREIENEAFSFAASLLLPEQQFRESFQLAASAGELFAVLFKMKSDWGVSVAAALRRCRDLVLINEGQYARACRELSIQGWRKAEPRRLRSEQSLLHEKVFIQLQKEGITPARLAEELNITVPDLLELMPISKKYLVEHQALEERPHLRLLA